MLKLNKNYKIAWTCTMQRGDAICTQNFRRITWKEDMGW